jgi:asparagine synthase (glutamine-hydrolysing)
MGFPEDRFSELPYAREVARRFGCDHQEFMMTETAIDLLPKIVQHYGEPYADASALPSFSLCEQTRRHVKVALCGDGGDELFAGYPRYQAMKVWNWFRRLPQGLRKQVLHALQHLPEGTAPFSLSWRLKRLLGIGINHPREAYLDTLCLFREEHKKSLYSDSLRATMQNFSAASYVNTKLDEATELPGIDRYLYADLLSYLPECLLVKMDIASMAHSLEVRSPFLDHEMVELVARFPADWKLRGFLKPKFILDQMISTWLPSTVIKRPKQGFSYPLSVLFRGPLKEFLNDQLLSQKAVGRGLFRKSIIQRWIEEHGSGRRDHSYGLWALLVLETWLQMFADDTRF